MTNPVIVVDKLSKRYELRTRPRHQLFSELFSEKLLSPFRRKPRGAQANSDEFWALSDVSFDVPAGEVLGIIGRNGAGKSTLLKILSRITQPSHGYARIVGRVGSLLEVGTGFHPELTGRENIFLNGALIGMKRQEILRKFDEIVAFAEIETFLDAPVKHYSSGMYTRLAFAVAAHLEPEILIVDEVLAVGDASFQKRCLGKMSEVAQGGRTVLFVSHNMAAMANLCQRLLLLAHGKLVSDGKPAEVIAAYLADESNRIVALGERTDRSGTGTLRFTSIRTHSAHSTASSLVCGQDSCIQVGIENFAQQPIRGLSIAIGIDDSLGARVAHLSSEVSGASLEQLNTGSNSIEVRIPRLPLLHGSYSLTLFASAGGEILDWISNAARFEVYEGDFFGTGKLPIAGQGQILIDHTFRVTPVRSE